LPPRRIGTSNSDIAFHSRYRTINRMVCCGWRMRILILLLDIWKPDQQQKSTYPIAPSVMAITPSIPAAA
jgi:hypothetical protein